MNYGSFRKLTPLYTACRLQAQAEERIWSKKSGTRRHAQEVSVLNLCRFKKTEWLHLYICKQFSHLVAIPFNASGGAEYQLFDACSKKSAPSAFFRFFTSFFSSSSVKNLFLSIYGLITDAVIFFAGITPLSVGFRRIVDNPSFISSSKEVEKIITFKFMALKTLFESIH